MEILRIILLLAVTVFIGCLIVLLVDIWKENKLTKKDKAYIRNFAVAFDETNDLPSALLKLKSMYSEKTKEYKAITKALQYLENSIYGDYETAASYIEDALYNKKIHDAHQIAIQMSIKKMSNYSLTDKLNETL